MIIRRVDEHYAKEKLAMELNSVKYQIDSVWPAAEIDHYYDDNYDDNDDIFLSFSRKSNREMIGIRFITLLRWLAGARKSSTVA